MKSGGSQRLLPKRWLSRQRLTSERGKLARDSILLALSAFSLSGFPLFGKEMPLAACLITAMPFGIRTLMTALGAVVGYAVSWGTDAAAMLALSALAALLFGAALIRAVYVPEGGGRKLVFTGFTAFYLCTCIELPQAVCSWLAGSTTVVALAQSAALAVFGLLGAACAMGALREAPQLPAEAENTGKTVPADSAKCTMN